MTLLGFALVSWVFAMCISLLLMSDALEPEPWLTAEQKSAIRKRNGLIAIVLFVITVPLLGFGMATAHNGEIRQIKALGYDVVEIKGRTATVKENGRYFRCEFDEIASEIVIQPIAECKSADFSSSTKDK